MLRELRADLGAVAWFHRRTAIAAFVVNGALPRSSSAFSMPVVRPVRRRRCDAYGAESGRASR
jgi:hypothetical protein